MSNLWEDAVTDRSQKDVDRVLELLAKVNFSSFTEEEQTEWLADEKGALNVSDLVRIKNNIELMLEVLLIENTVSDIPNYPQADYYNELLNNVKAIHDAGFVKRTTPQVPEAPLNTYSKWNDIEQILLDTYDILLNNFHYYCGADQVFAGDSVGLLL